GARRRIAWRVRGPRRRRSRRNVSLGVCHRGGLPRALVRSDGRHGGAPAARGRQPDAGDHHRGRSRPGHAGRLSVPSGRPQDQVAWCPAPPPTWVDTPTMSPAVAVGGRGGRLEVRHAPPDAARATGDDGRWPAMAYLRTFTHDVFVSYAHG